MRRCNGICPHLKYIKSLRWVRAKYKYKYCSKCDVYFQTIRITCECCKDTLRCRYMSSYSKKKMWVERSRKIRRHISYLRNIDTAKVYKLINHERVKKTQLDYYYRHKEVISARRKIRYAQSINRITPLANM